MSTEPETGLREALIAAADEIGSGPDGCHLAPLVDDDTLRSDDNHHGAAFIDALLADRRVVAAIEAVREGEA